MICGCWLLVSAMAQTSSLFTTTDKTTSLIYLFSIPHVDRGTKDVLVEQMSEADTVLPIKAPFQNFNKANLSVLTSDGGLYSLPVNYDGHPTVVLWQIPSQTGISSACYAHGILDNALVKLGAGNHNGGVCGKLFGTGVKRNVIYYRLRPRNLSLVDYDIGLLKFCIRDKKRAAERRYRKMNRHQCTLQAIPLW